LVFSARSARRTPSAKIKTGKLFGICLAGREIQGNRKTNENINGKSIQYTAKYPADISGRFELLVKRFGCAKQISQAAASPIRRTREIPAI
jgi:hypothetical protein